MGACVACMDSSVLRRKQVTTFIKNTKPGATKSFRPKWRGQKKGAMAASANPSPAAAENAKEKRAFPSAAAGPKKRRVGLKCGIVAASVLSVQILNKSVVYRSLSHLGGGW